MPQGSLANPEGYRRDQRVDYREPEAERVSRAGTGGRFFLAGAWRAEAESVVALEAGARLVVPFRARDLFVVAGPASGMDLVEVALDGRPIAMEAAGRDVRGGVLRLDRVGLYRVVALDEAARHVLTLTARSPGARFYTFTFG